METNKEKDMINQSIIKLGENGFRRSSKDQIINFLNIINESGQSTKTEILKKFKEKKVYKKEKEVDNFSRSFSLFSRLGLIEQTSSQGYKLTDLGIKLIKNQDKDAIEKFGPYGFEFLIALMNLSEGWFYEKNSEIPKTSFLKAFLIEIIKNKEINFEDFFLQLQKSNFWSKKISKETFIKLMTENLNKKDELQKEKCAEKERFWQNYFNVAKLSYNNPSLAKQEYVKLFRQYKINVKTDQTGWKRTEKFELPLLGITQTFWRKTKFSDQDIMDKYDPKNFIWTFSEEDMGKKFVDYKIHYSYKDNRDITKRTLHLFPAFNFVPKNINRNKVWYVKLDDQYTNFLKYIANNYDVIAQIIQGNQRIELSALTKYMNLKIQTKEKGNINQIIDQIGTEKINQIYNSFTNNKNTNVIIDSTNYLDSSTATNPTWFEYFTVLKLISISDGQLDESIWNGKLDNNFKPISFAVGGKPDIQFTYNDHKIMTEVTLSFGSSQTKMEAEPIRRHFVEGKFDGCIFVAPEIHKQTESDLKSGFLNKEDKKVDTNIIKSLQVNELTKMKTLDELYKFCMK